MNRYLDQLAQRYPQGQYRGKVGQLAGVLGLITNLLLGIVKVILGLVTGSVSIMADATNNLSDSVSSLLTVVGFVAANKPADKEHPFGHERFESISGLLISLLVTFVGLQFLKTSVLKIFNPTALKMNTLILVILLLSIGVKFWQSYAYRTLGKRIDSSALKASSQDSINDCLTTGVVLIAAAIQSLTHLQIDGYVGLAVALYILVSGIKMLQSFIADLLGESPSEEEIEKMRRQLKSYRKILGFHDLIYHSYGKTHQFATVHVEVDDRLSLEQAHDIVDMIEKDFAENLNILLVCHVDPVDLTNSRRQKIRKRLRRFLGYLEDDLSLHDLRLTKEGPENNEHLSFDVVIPRKSHYSDEELLQKIKKFCGEELHISEVDIVFDHNYLLQE